MAAVSLYRKYRPQVFADVAGQESVTRGLLGSLRAGGISHAYLFTGPRGSGKTTTARLLAKSVNCRNNAQLAPGGSGAPPSTGESSERSGEPCNECDLCVMANEGRFLDIVELDAASNRGIDEIRQLREQVAFAPSMGRYKTYILDEVHMLTKDAANAFLKTLEEPPPHVLFVLATTEAHKVLATIASRCQRYDFQRIPVQAAKLRLQQVLEAEKIDTVKAEALDEIARRGDGSLRDSLGLLEQVMALTGAGTPIGTDDVRRALGLARAEQIDQLSAGLASRDASRILGVLAQLHEQGIEPHAILGQITEYLREQLVEQLGGEAKSSGFANDRLIAVLSRLSALNPAVRAALSPRLTLEVGLLDAAYAEMVEGRQELSARLDTLAAAVASLEARLAGGGPVATVSAPRTAVVSEPPAVSPPPLAPAPTVRLQPEPVEPMEPPPPLDDSMDLAPEPAGGDETWAKVLEGVRSEKPTTEALAKEARPILEGKKLRVVFSRQHAFHKTRLSEPDHKALLGKHVKTHYGSGVTVSIEEDAAPPGKEQAQAPARGDWARESAKEDKTVQLLKEVFDAEVVRLE